MDLEAVSLEPAVHDPNTQARRYEKSGCEASMVHEGLKLEEMGNQRVRAGP